MGANAANGSSVSAANTWLHAAIAIGGSARRRRFSHTPASA